MVGKHGCSAGERRREGVKEHRTRIITVQADEGEDLRAPGPDDLYVSGKLTVVEQKSGIVVVQDKSDLVDRAAGIDWYPGTACTENTEQCRKGARVVGTVDGCVLAALKTYC